MQPQLSKQPSSSAINVHVGGKRLYLVRLPTLRIDDEDVPC